MSRLRDARSRAETPLLSLMSGDAPWATSHASCAGSNTCAGVSYHSSSGKLSEHTCKGTNICAGMSCVDLAKGSGLTGAEILEGYKNGEMVGSETQCNFCHEEGKTNFVLPIAPGPVSLDDAMNHAAPWLADAAERAARWLCLFGSARP